MKTHFILYIGICLLFTSCFVFNSGGISSGPLLNLNDKRVALAYGESRSVFVLGIGYAERDHLVNEAKENMYKNRPLASNEYYSNITYDISHKLIFFGIVFIRKVTVTAAVLRSGPDLNENTSVEPNPGIPPEKKRDPNERSYFINEVDSFYVGETVYYESQSGTISEYVIESVIGSNVNLNNVSPKKNTQVTTKAPLYTTKKKIQGYMAGDKVRAKLLMIYERSVITAVNTTNALFQVGDEFYVKKLSALKEDK